MNWVISLAFLVVVLPIAAKEDDRQAVEYYLQALRGLSDADLSLELESEQEACSLILSLLNSYWLENYSAHRNATLGKLGIRPESVRVLRTAIVNRLVKNFAVRILENKPFKNPCAHSVSRRYISGDMTINLTNIYRIGDLLDALLVYSSTAAESFFLPEVVRRRWEKSVIEECEREMRSLDEQWPKYGRACRILIKVLGDGADPQTFGLTVEMTAKLRGAAKQ